MQSKDPELIERFLCSPRNHLFSYSLVLCEVAPGDAEMAEMEPRYICVKTCLQGQLGDGEIGVLLGS